MKHSSVFLLPDTDDSQHVSNGAYLMRPHTSLTIQWLKSLNLRLDSKKEELEKHPAPFSRCCHNKENDYPIGWSELHGDVFSIVQMLYINHVKQGGPWFSGCAYKL